MTFWALGKVKNITQKLNLKDFRDYKEYGSKIIKTYINKQDEQQSQDKNQFYDFIDHNYQAKKQQHNQYNIKPSKNRTQQDLMEIQIEQYKKLTQLQYKLFKKHQQQQLKNLTREHIQLQAQLNQLTQQETQQIQEFQKEKLKMLIRTGQKDLKQVIKENIRMKQEIQKKKVQNYHKNNKQIQSQSGIQNS